MENAKTIHADRRATKVVNIEFMLESRESEGVKAQLSRLLFNNLTCSSLSLLRKRNNVPVFQALLRPFLIGSIKQSNSIKPPSGRAICRLQSVTFRIPGVSFS
jgi:hypothetical protein